VAILDALPLPLPDPRDRSTVPGFADHGNAQTTLPLGSVRSGGTVAMPVLGPAIASLVSVDVPEVPGLLGIDELAATGALDLTRGHLPAPAVSKLLVLPPVPPPAGVAAAHFGNAPGGMIFVGGWLETVGPRDPFRRVDQWLSHAAPRRGRSAGARADPVVGMQARSGKKPNAHARRQKR
jgi:hypothetical protein